MEQTAIKESTMPATEAAINIDEILREVGPDSTATFDNSPSRPTEHASSENLRLAPKDEDDEDIEDDEDEDEDLEDEDDLDEDADDEDEDLEDVDDEDDEDEDDDEEDEDEDDEDA